MPVTICIPRQMWHLLLSMTAFGIRGLLRILAMIALAGHSIATDADDAQSFTAKAVVAILGPREGLTVAEYKKIQLATKEIITSILSAAERKAIQQLNPTTTDGLSVKVDAVPDSLVFEINATAPSSKMAADFANAVAGQLEQALPNADPAAIAQIDAEFGGSPILLILETAKLSPITVVAR